VRRVSSTAALVAAAVTVAFTAACGGGSDDSSGNGRNADGGGNNAFTAYAECLQKNGVTITMPSGGVRNRPSDGASRGPFPEGGRPSGAPRPSGSGGPGGGGFPGGGGMGKPAGVDDATWEKAQTACASLRPTGRGGNGMGNGANAAYQNCLRDHGVTATGGPLDTTDATVTKAVEACKVLQPQAGATPTG
jgi:hypothetical protein